MTNPCFGTGATANVCLQIPKHQQLYAFQAEGYCVHIMMSSVQKGFASKVLNKKSDILEDLKTDEAFQTLLKARNTGRSVRRSYVWAHPRWLPSVQTFSSHIFQFLTQYHMHMTLHNNARQLPLTFWCENWLSILSLLDDEAGLVHECEF